MNRAVQSNAQEAVTALRRHTNDTGSSEVQIALLTERIQSLSKHLEKFNKDYSSRRGLMHLVNQRRKLLDYLKSGNEAKYSEVIARLGLRR